MWWQKLVVVNLPNPSGHPGYLADDLSIKTWPLVNEFCWNWVQLTQPLKSIGFGIKVQSVFWSSRRRRTEQEMIWTNQKLPLMIHVLWPGFPFSFSLCSGPMRKDCCFDSAVQEVLCITWEVSDREIAWVAPQAVDKRLCLCTLIFALQQLQNCCT